MNSPDPMPDYRARIERARLEAAKARSEAISEQRSAVNTPAQRVRAWERLHQVTLPKSPSHAVLRVVARQTGMTLADIQAVQQQRVQPPGA
jgi:hypothetical protein